ncbi:MAG: hypothetical protein ABSE51_24650, partial [Terracidiphilus sp.]
KLSDLQLELLDREPAVSSEEIQAEAERGPLPDSAENAQADRIRGQGVMYLTRIERPGKANQTDDCAARTDQELKGQPERLTT